MNFVLCLITISLLVSAIVCYIKVELIKPEAAYTSKAFICKKCENNDDCKEGYDCKNQECIWGKEAIECYGCGYNKNCKSIDEFDEKWQCLSGWEKCQIVTHHILGKDVYVNGGCEPGPPLKEDKCERREVSITGNSKNATVCTCSKHLCNGPDYGCGSK